MVYNAIQWYTYTSVEIFTIQMIQMSGTHLSTQWRIFQYYTANTMVPSTTQWRIFQYYTANTMVPSTNTMVPSTNTMVPSTNTMVPSTNTMLPSTNTVLPSTNTMVPSTTQWRIFQYYTTNTLSCHHLPPPLLL